MALHGLPNCWTDVSCVLHALCGWPLGQRCFIVGATEASDDNNPQYGVLPRHLQTSLDAPRTLLSL